MLSTKIEHLPKKARDNVSELFLHAALSYELGGDWKRIYRLRMNNSIGTVKQFCSFWLKATSADMERAITVFLEDIH